MLFFLVKGAIGEPGTRTLVPNDVTTFGSESKFLKYDRAIGDLQVFPAQAVI
jgi:hypothetical protein